MYPCPAAGAARIDGRSTNISARVTA